VDVMIIFIDAAFLAHTHTHTHTRTHVHMYIHTTHT
jgi:hypothetical protein